MAFANQAGINVASWYGARDTGGSVGVERSTDSVHQLSLELTGDSVNDQLAAGALLGPKFVMPAGAHVLRYILHVDQAFDLGGTNPTIRVGSQGSISTNGVVLTEAELEATGTKIPASAGAGTWSTTSATGLTAAAAVAIDAGGTTPTVARGVGQATLIVEYVYKNRTVS